MSTALLLVLLSGCGSHLEADREVEVVIAPQAAVAEVDDRYLSFAVDISQVLGMSFWNPDAAGDAETPVDPYDFEREDLHTLAAALAPAFLRIGGTDADHVYYDLSNDPVSTPPDPWEAVLTAERWAEVATFAQDNGLDLMFALDAGYGPRDDTGAWDPDYARALLEHTALEGYPVEVWELGNEPNAFILEHGQSLDPEVYGRDLLTLAALRDEAHPGARIAAPGAAWWPVSGEFVEFTEPALAEGGEAVDIVNWHYYPQQSQRCPVATREAGLEVMLDPENLDEVSTWAQAVEAARDTCAPGAEVWLGESGNAQCGGEPGVSDRFAGSFWWLDQLGLLARRGQGVQVRQTLSGSDYGLLDDTTLAPRPDYWASLLWRTLMGTRVLDVTSDDTHLRVHAHCALDRPGDVVLLALNLHESDSALVLPEGVEPGSLEAWRVEADALDATEVTLNGTPLSFTSGGSLPDLAGEEVEGLVLPPRSYGFLRLVDAAAEACS